MGHCGLTSRPQTHTQRCEPQTAVLSFARVFKTGKQQGITTGVLVQQPRQHHGVEPPVVAPCCAAAALQYSPALQPCTAADPPELDVALVMRAGQPPEVGAAGAALPDAWWRPSVREEWCGLGFASLPALATGCVCLGAQPKWHARE